MSERMWEDLREARAERDALRRVLAEKCDALVWKRLVGAEMQLDEVRAERDRLRRELEDAIQRLGGYPDSRLDGEGGLAAAVMNDCARLERERDAAIAERDRLRAELVEWRDSLASWPDYWTVEVSEIRYRIDAILSGGES